MSTREIRVSPVVGTILLIAITVALAAVVATLVSGLGGRGTPPSVLLEVTAKVNEIDNENIDLTIVHNGGDDLKLVELVIWASRYDGLYPVEVRWVAGIFSKGDRITVSYCYGAEVPDNAVIDVRISNKIFHNPSLEVET